MTVPVLAFLILAAADTVTIALVGVVGTVVAALISGAFVAYRVVVVDRPQLTAAQLKAVTEDARASREEATEARQETQRVHLLLMKSEEARRAEAVQADAKMQELRGQVADLKGMVARLTAEVQIWKAAANGGADL